MSAKDIIKKSILEQFNSDISATSTLIMLLIVVLIGVYIFFVYRALCRKAFYSRNFAISLVVISLITSLIILAVQSSIVISLGMVGALSIVRFRTAIKDPMDLAFLFWSISVGIICGAGLHEVAIIGSIVITIAMLGLQLIPNVQPAMLLILHASKNDIEDEINKVIKSNTKASNVKSRNITANGMDMIIEVKPNNEAQFIKTISEIEGVVSASLMQHDGEVTV